MSPSRVALPPDRSAELDPAALRSHLQRADPAILLAVLAQLTGDASLLDSYAHEISHVPDPPEMAGQAAPDVFAELVDRLVEAMTGERVEAGAPVDPDLFARLAPLALGVPVGDEYLPMLLEQGGFREAQPVLPRTSAVPDTMSVAIVGAGLAGIAAGIAAGKAGIPYEIFDRGSDLGGTWNIQTYPGVAVDTPAAYYSYSFELNTVWSNYYPKGGEYQNYLRAVAVPEHDPDAWVGRIDEVMAAGDMIISRSMWAQLDAVARRLGPDVYAEWSAIGIRPDVTGKLSS